MNNVDFPEANIKIAEHQEEYETVHAYHNKQEGSMTMCFKLDEDEINRMYATGEVWLKVLTFGQPMQPIGMSVNKEDLIK